MHNAFKGVREDANSASANISEELKIGCPIAVVLNLPSVCRIDILIAKMPIKKINGNNTRARDTVVLNRVGFCKNPGAIIVTSRGAARIPTTEIINNMIVII